MAFSTFPNNPFPPSTAQFEEGKNDEIQAEIDAMKDGTNIDSFGDVETVLATKANSADVETALATKANSTDVETALATKTNLSNIAPTFDATSGVYDVGDKVIYSGVLYEFTTAHSTAGEWDESEVQAVKVSELIDTLKSGLTNVGACDDILVIANADTTQRTFINNIAGYRLLMIYTSYYNNSPNPVYNSVVIPVALIASITEYMEFDGISIVFSYGVNAVQVSDWGTNSHPYVHFVGIK